MPPKQRKPGQTGGDPGHRKNIKAYVKSSPETSKAPKGCLDDAFDGCLGVLAFAFVVSIAIVAAVNHGWA